jgi:hypothetical protein
MAITLTPAKGIGGALLLVIVGVACHLIVPMTSPNPIMQALQSAIGIAGCIVALLGMGAFDMINPTTDAIKRAKLQLPGIFKPIVITTAIALAIRFAFNAPSAIATIANIPYYLAYYVHGAIFEECLFRVAILLILAYVTLRYEFKMSVTAVIALIHDMLIILGIYAWTQIPVTPNVVAALLSTMGFSLYDTVVEFDRTNDNAKTLRDGIHRTYLEICNFSINEVVVRSINTTITTLVPELAMYFFGGATLKDFAFAMILGELLGTYSSYAVATPLLAIWKTREPRWAKLEAKYGEGAGAPTPVTEA